MSRVAIVGVEGSGKTVLMTALADLYGKPSADSPYLMPENQSAFSFMTQIPHKMREAHQWPAATAIASMKHLKWTIRIGQNVLMDLEMLDYPGELYRMAFGERKKEEIAPYLEQVHEFLEHLVTADILVVLLNLRDAMDIGANARNNETVWLTRGIFDYSRKLPNIQKRLLLFTQSDRYPDELSGSGGLVAAKEKYMPMLHVLYPDLECAAVSVATDASDTPASTFSASHGVTGLMRWLALQTEAGKKVQAQLDKFTEAFEKASSRHSAPILIKAMAEELDTINPGLCDILEPNGLEHRRNQLRMLYQQSALAACEACREQAASAISLDALKRIVGEYSRHITCFTDPNANLSSAGDVAAIQDHELHCEQLKQYLAYVDKIIDNNFPWELARKRTWLAVSSKYPDEIFQKHIARIQSFYAAAKWWCILAAVGSVCILVVIWLAIHGSDVAYQERAAAEAKAQQERAAAEAKAEPELVALASAATKGDSKALATIAQMAEKGLASAQWHLGNIFSDAANESAAIKWWEKAARQGHLNAQLQLGKISENYAAKEWYAMAANQGNIDAQMAMGSLCEKDYYGYGDPEAAKWYSMAAEQGNIDAQMALGRVWEDRNRKQATKWYRMVADKGDSGAQFKMGEMKEIMGEEPTAVEWYRKAARQGHAAAQQALRRLGYIW